ncbi:hypothetical protein CR513_56512, partial [Mucuna pruriens]
MGLQGRIELLGRPNNKLACLAGCPFFFLALTGSGRVRRVWTGQYTTSQAFGHRREACLSSCASRSLRGSHSDWSSGSSNPDSSSARGSETQHSATLVAKEKFPFTILFREAQKSDSKGLPSWIDPRVSKVNFVYTRPDSLVGMANAICHRGPWSVEVLPCQSDEIVCKWVVETEEPYFYLYETLFSKLGIRLPFTNIERAAIWVLNVASTQLHPNNWTFVRAFELPCEGMGKEPSLNVFF